MKDNGGTPSLKSESPKPDNSAALRKGILLWLTAQNSVHTLLVSYVRTRPVQHMFMSSVAILFTEITKFVLCLCAVVVEQSGPVGCCRSIYDTVVLQPMDTLKVCVPSFIYVLQNNLFYLAASHLDAATFMITSQLKILTTAMFSVLMLSKPLTRIQWLSLFLLFSGVSIVQLQSESKKDSYREKTPLIGFLAVLSASTLSGFAGIYFEKILKGSAPISVWMRNIQLSVCAIPISLVTVLAKDYESVDQNGILYGFDEVVWATVVWYGIGGLSVAVCIKYADNILKNFATSVAIIISTLASMYLFGFQPTVLFVFGAALVIVSIFLYSTPPEVFSGKK